MREQVIVLPPSVEGRTAAFSLSRKEDALLDTSKERKTWLISEGKNAEQVRGFGLIDRDLKEVIHAEFNSAENMMLVDAKEASAESFKGACEDVKQGKAYPEGSLAPERMKNSPSSNGVEGAPFLHWGLRKRSRCSRADIYSPGIGVDNHNIKLGSLADKSSVLSREMVRVQAERASTACLNIGSHASKGVTKSAATKREQCSEEKLNQQEKVLKERPSDAQQGTKASPLRGGMRRCPSAHKQDQLLQQRKTCTLADPNLPPKGRCVTPLPGSNNPPNQLVWPKFVIGLSRKEKEEDFLILKGTKLPQRPKRRPKVVERALHYCSPGTSLVDILPLRYDVKEKRRARKRPRGLKEMESLDSDSD